jgi:hypothetical protein
MNTASVSTLLNGARGTGCVREDRGGRWPRGGGKRRVLLRVSRAAWRLEQAERERSWALASARAEGVSIRTLAAAVGLSSSRVHQIVAAADLDELDAALGELRAAGWPAPSPLPLSGLLGLPPLIPRMGVAAVWPWTSSAVLRRKDRSTSSPG